MKILVIADKSPNIPINKIISQNTDISLIITLGDLGIVELQGLENIKHIPKIGVYGNHCSGNYFEEFGIKNLHLKIFELDGMTFGGFEGCVRYKPRGNFQYTQEESLEMIKILPKVDVIVCHCPPFGINDDYSDNAHIGFKGLLEYVETYNPKHLFHGHTYEYSYNPFIKSYLDTKIHYINGFNVIEI